MNMYKPPKPGSKIIIVGGGCFGLSTAHALALKKIYQVVVFDRLPIPVPDAASSDISKAVRFDYGNNLLYMNLTLEAMPYWHQWNKERAIQNEPPVFHQTGVLLFGHQGKFGDYELESMKAIREAGYGHCIEELLTPEAILKKYPHFEETVKNSYDIAYFNKEGGWCNSSEAIKHLYGKCIKEGVQFVIGQDQGCYKELWIEDNSDVRGIITRDGQHHIADNVIFATGAWTAGLLGINEELLATGQVVMHFKPNKSNLQALMDQPVWCADVANTGYYGFPANEDGKLKIARHHSGYLNPRSGDDISIPRTQVDHANDTIPISALQHARTFLGKFLPMTSSMDITYTRVCWYSDSKDGDFLICPHPNYSNVVIASGDSGHAMKMLPVIGYKICHVIEGIDSDYSRAWCWRTTIEEKFDAFRGRIENVRTTLGDQDGGGRFATQHELLAAKHRL
ncbi:FAD dependent oxidoreductase, partial [Halteromyces radiatus]|uniref:FAD dependent oxidoreductase n=1 Tax=Halteromyces radiatus TaxID=101107 RepID=UPI0022201AB9